MRKKKGRRRKEMKRIEKVTRKGNAYGKKGKGGER